MKIIVYAFEILSILSIHSYSLHRPIKNKNSEKVKKFQKRWKIITIIFGLCKLKPSSKKNNIYHSVSHSCNI